MPDCLYHFMKRLLSQDKNRLTGDRATMWVRLIRSLGEYASTTG